MAPKQTKHGEARVLKTRRKQSNQHYCEAL